MFESSTLNETHPTRSAHAVLHLNVYRDIQIVSNGLIICLYQYVTLNNERLSVN